MFLVSDLSRKIAFDGAQTCYYRRYCYRRGLQREGNPNGQKGKAYYGGHGITGHDFTGRWLGECHAIGWQSYVLHVSCTVS